MDHLDYTQDPDDRYTTAGLISTLTGVYKIDPYYTTCI